MARDRKRAKQRRDAALRRRPRARRSAARDRRRASRCAPTCPAALDHASGEVDEFDAALVRGAGGVPARPTSSPRRRSRPRRSPRATSPRTRCRSSRRLRRRQPRRWRCAAARAAAGDGGGVSARAGVRRAAARRQPRDRLPARQLGRAPARTVARPPPGHPGDRRRARLRRDRRRLPRPGRLRGQGNRRIHPLRSLNVSLVRRQHLLRSREQGQAQPRAPRGLARASSAPCAASSCRPKPSRR